MGDLAWSMVSLTQTAPVVAIAIVGMPLALLVVVLFVPSEKPAKRLVRIIRAFAGRPIGPRSSRPERREE